MREKTLQLLITFSSTVQAMSMETQAHAAGLPGRLIPVPTAITAGCGLAYKAPLDSCAQLLELMEEAGLEPEQVVEMLL